jgi:hypothetical protein
VLIRLPPKTVPCPGERGAAARRHSPPGALCTTYAPPFVITNEQNRFDAASAFKNARLPLQGIVLEPEGRSTAPAAAVATHLAIQKAGPGAIVLVIPSDHHIDKPQAFLDAVETGLERASDVRAGRLVMTTACAGGSRPFPAERAHARHIRHQTPEAGHRLRLCEDVWGARLGRGAQG